MFAFLASASCCRRIRDWRRTKAARMGGVQVGGRASWQVDGGYVCRYVQYLGCFEALVENE